MHDRRAANKELERFHSDFKLVARFFVEKRKGNIEWMKHNKEKIIHVDAILKLLSVMTDDKQYEDIIRNGDSKEVHTMCEVVEYFTNKGVVQGIAQGEENGKVSLTINMLKKGFSEETILSLGITKDQLTKAKELCLEKV